MRQISASFRSARHRRSIRVVCQRRFGTHATVARRAAWFVAPLLERLVSLDSCLANAILFPTAQTGVRTATLALLDVLDVGLEVRFVFLLFFWFLGPCFDVCLPLPKFPPGPATFNATIEPPPPRQMLVSSRATFAFVAAHVRNTHRVFVA